MRSACPTNSAADAAGPAPGQAQRPGPALALWQAARPVVTGRAAHRELGVAQCPLPPLCSPGSLGKSATYILTSLLLRAPVRFMAKKAGAKKRLLPDPVAHIGGAVGGASSLQLAPSRASMTVAAVGLRAAKRPKGGQLKAPTTEIPWTNQNVPNRGMRMGTVSHRVSWDATASPSPGPRSGPMAYVGDEGHWANTRFSMDEWLVIEEAKKNQPGWDHAVKQKWVQPRELDPAVGYFAKQAVVRSPLMNGWICEACADSLSLPPVPAGVLLVLQPCDGEASHQQKFGQHRQDRGNNLLDTYYYEPPPTWDAGRGHPSPTWSFNIKTHWYTHSRRRGANEFL